MWGLRTKVNVFLNNILAKDYNVIDLTETNLQAGFNTNEVFPVRIIFLERIGI